MDKVEPIFKAQLVRNLKAFLAAKGEDLDLTRTPEYLTQGVNLIKKVYGVKLGAFISGTNPHRFGKWSKGNDLPSTFEAGSLLNAIEITEILLGKLSPPRAKEWMVSPHKYLFYMLPVDFMVEGDTEQVRNAALQLFI